MITHSRYIYCIICNEIHYDNIDYMICLLSPVCSKGMLDI